MGLWPLVWPWKSLTHAKKTLTFTQTITTQNVEEIVPYKYTFLESRTPKLSAGTKYDTFRIFIVEKWIFVRLWVCGGKCENGCCTMYAMPNSKVVRCVGACTWRTRSYQIRILRTYQIHTKSTNITNSPIFGHGTSFYCTLYSLGLPYKWNVCSTPSF